MYVQNVALRAYAGLHGRWSDYRSMYEAHNWALAYLVARWTSAVFGTATVLAIYAAMAPLFGLGAALIAASLVAVSTIHVLSSKFATTDVAAAFWVTLACAMILRIAHGGRWRHYLAAGVFCALGFATKYPAGGTVIGIAVAHLEAWSLNRPRRPLFSALSDRRLYLAIGVAALAGFCAGPYLVLDWHQTIRDLRDQWANVMIIGVVNRYGWPFLMLQALPICFGVILEFLIVGGILWGVLRAKPGALALAAFIAIEFLMLSRAHRVFFRYLLIPFPAMVILAAAFASDLTALAAAKVGRKLTIAGAALVFAAITVPFLARDIEVNQLLLRVDTRILARQWIETHIPDGSVIAITSNTGDFGKPQLSAGYRLVPMGESLEGMRAKGIQWVFSDSLDQLPGFSSGPSARQQSELAARAALVFDVDPIRTGATAPVFDQEDAFYVPVRNITSMERPGPRIRIWRLK